MSSWESPIHLMHTVAWMIAPLLGLLGVMPGREFMERAALGPPLSSLPRSSHCMGR